MHPIDSHSMEAGCDEGGVYSSDEVQGSPCIQTVRVQIRYDRACSETVRVQKPCVVVFFSVIKANPSPYGSWTVVFHEACGAN
jgi:hypothetical protein